MAILEKSEWQEVNSEQQKKEAARKKGERGRIS